MQDDYKLDNPVWFSLSESHNDVAVDYGDIKFYHPDFCPFGGFERKENISRYIEQYSLLTNNFYIVGEKPVLPAGLKITRELVCLQMVIDNTIEMDKKNQIVKLSGEHHCTLYELVNLVQPGYFKSRTALLGNYYGIFRDDELIAVTGERMKMNHYTEVSAVVTHPDHTGQGYAKQLIAETVNTIMLQNKVPYLHVAENNFIAIKLYESLGFKTRRKISLWNISK